MSFRSAVELIVVLFFGGAAFVASTVGAYVWLYNLFDFNGEETPTFIFYALIPGHLGLVIGTVIGIFSAKLVIKLIFPSTKKTDLTASPDDEIDMSIIRGIK